MVKLRKNRMWVMATSPKNYIALFSFQKPIWGLIQMLNKKIGVGTPYENLKRGCSSVG